MSPGNGYGLTETSAVAVQNSGLDYLRKPESVGLPVPICEVRITDEAGNPLPVGEPGEIRIRGTNVFRGYWNRPGDTAATLVEGWLRTGDIGRLDGEGFLYVVDLAKDMVIRGGENVYCVEVENVLYAHPGVMDAAVFGVPHRVLGEEVVALVQAAPAHMPESDGARAALEEALRAHVGEHLAAFKVPVAIRIVDTPLPRNANGKILKDALRQAWLAGGGAGEAT